MIKSFKSKALERFWVKGDPRRLNPQHVDKITRQLNKLDTSLKPEDMDVAGWRFHRLHGNRWSVRIDKNWRLTFGWSEDGPDAVDVDYEDYH